MSIIRYSVKLLQRSPLPIRAGPEQQRILRPLPHLHPLHPQPHISTLTSEEPNKILSPNLKFIQFKKSLTSK
ncbi:hypothetical protein Cni_G15812 [Canna indica]|uniref:Uncharacterized protein n=1 Tax=Canna indica TaxID=4628 RepID=A0AAQ3KK41_9LILI|nr:hypothetical protein Cni_G15812 [Canna indica]